MNRRRSMHTSIFTQIVCALSFSTVAACGGATQSTSSTGTSTEAEALAASTAAEATFQTQATQCADAFQTCVSAANADVATCKEELEKCLPNVPPPGPGCGLWDDGGVPTPPPPCDGGHAIPPPQQEPPLGPPQGAPPPDGDDDGGDGPHHGGQPPPPPPFGDGDGGGDPNHGGPPGAGHPPPAFCGHVPLPPSPALEACRTGLETCMQSATDDTAKRSCLDAAHTCVKDAFDAARAAAN